MIRTLLSLAFCFFLVFTGGAQSAPKREFRGAWIATHLGIDWPNPSHSPATQRANLLTILDHHQATGMNAVYLQVRSQCDALYPSALEPWAHVLTGRQGQAPADGWDPLQFAIEECHKRGLELHAWINPYRAMSNAGQLATFADNHVAKRHPEWLLATGIIRTLNPGIPEVRQYINSVISDIVSRYDVDGIHFDDYFYPNAAFNDDAAYAADPRGISDRGDWRRDNVNLLIREVSATIGGLKPWVKFGVSPSGIYRNSTNPAVGSATSGLQHYVSLYADSRKWLQEGWIDYLAPQVYWWIGQPGANYGVLIPWWNNNAYGRHIYIGMAGYKVDDLAQGVNWANPQQIPNQVRMNRDAAHPNIYGQAVYNTNSLRSNKKGFRDSLRLHFYAKPALQPAMAWKDNTPPPAPSALTAVKTATGAVELDWTAPAATTDEMNKVRQYVVYRSESPDMDQTDGASILAITPTTTTTFTDATASPDATYYYTVAALDRLHNESTPSNGAANLPPQITCPADQVLVVNDGCTATVPDYRSLATLDNHGAPTDGITVTQSPAPGMVLSGTGAYTVTLTASDRAGNSTSCTFTVRLEDHVPPVITGVSADPSTLYVPNHQLREVTVSYTATDNCPGVTTSLSVSSNEEANGTGDGNTESDWEIVDEHRMKLRAERSGNGSGRVYTITITATDAAGNSTTETVTVTVPHNTDAITRSSAAGQAGSEAPAGLKISVAPNPATDYFTLHTQSAAAAPLTLRVTDGTGRVVEARQGLAPDGSLRLGAAYRPGVYFAEIRQGNSVQTIKLVKAAH